MGPYGLVETVPATARESGDKLVIQPWGPSTDLTLELTLSSGPTAVAAVAGKNTAYKWYTVSAVAVATGFAPTASGTYRVGATKRQALRVSLPDVMPRPLIEEDFEERGAAVYLQPFSFYTLAQWKQFGLGYSQITIIADKDTPEVALPIDQPATDMTAYRGETLRLYLPASPQNQDGFGLTGGIGNYSWMVVGATVYFEHWSVPSSKEMRGTVVAGPTPITGFPLGRQVDVRIDHVDDGMTGIGGNWRLGNMPRTMFSIPFGHIHPGASLAPDAMPLDGTNAFDTNSIKHIEANAWHQPRFLFGSSFFPQQHQVLAGGDTPPARQAARHHRALRDGGPRGGFLRLELQRTRAGRRRNGQALRLGHRLGRRQRGAR